MFHWCSLFREARRIPKEVFHRETGLHHTGSLWPNIKGIKTLMTLNIVAAAAKVREVFRPLGLKNLIMHWFLQNYDFLNLNTWIMNLSFCLLKMSEICEFTFWKSGFHIKEIFEFYNPFTHFGKIGLLLS